jgi:Rrf2 family iron-sulfur cluster assembly transcriptional regulator
MTMKISTKGRFAVTAMMELALREQRGPLTLADISATQNISISYLEQLFAKLRQSGLVKGMRGPGGGYTLARSANDISVADIVLAVDEKAYAGRHPSTVLPADPEARLIQQLWGDLSTRIYDYLNDLSLADVSRQPAASSELLAKDKAA